MNQYLERQNAEPRLARQAPDVKRTAKEIFAALADIERYLYWSLDPSEKDGGAYYQTNLIDQAHALVDLGHAWRAVLTANPPPKEEEDDDNAAA